MRQVNEFIQLSLVQQPGGVALTMFATNGAQNIEHTEHFDGATGQNRLNELVMHAMMRGFIQT